MSSRMPELGRVFLQAEVNWGRSIWSMARLAREYG
jgi:hypothetical protein